MSEQKTVGKMLRLLRLLVFNVSKPIAVVAQRADMSIRTVYRYARISANSIAEWHLTLCLATQTTTSAITVSCLPQKAGHSLQHMTSIQEPSHINACS